MVRKYKIAEESMLAWTEYYSMMMYNHGAGDT